MPLLMEALGTALRAEAARVERVGTNLANVLSVGYRREVMDVPAPGIGAPSGFVRLIDAGAATGPAVSQAADATSFTTLRDLRPGTLRTTGQAWDVALVSDGYFEISTPTGLRYTRNGQFHLDATGRLVTMAGHPVMGLAGDIRPGPGRPTIEADGRIWVDGRVEGRLRIVRFDNAADLRPAADGQLASRHPGLAQAAEAAGVRQGALENANVNQGHEMVDLMRTVRHFESTVRAVQAYDELLGGAIRRLGEH